MFQTIGHKVSRLGDVIQQPRLLSLYLKGIQLNIFESLNKDWILNAHIRTVLDIGGNTGQFARAIRELLPEAYIYSFEPLSDCFDELQRTMNGTNKFQAFNTALDDHEGDAIINRSEWTPSSSMRPMASLHKENFPHTARTSNETVRVRRLDDYIDELKLEENVLIKIDVQGYEDKVIAGGTRILQQAHILVVETSIEALYENQPLFRDICAILEAQGFTYRGMLNQMASAIDGRILYGDAVFARKS